MPILIFYLLKDWKIIINKIDLIFPEKYANQIKKILELVDKSISGFIRGQINVCIILATYYGILLGLLDLNNGIFIGILTGILSFVPYIGYGIGITIAMVVSIFQWGLNWPDIGAVLVVYAIGQIIESNFLVPNLIGKKINVHPFWMILGIFFFGSVFGFIGILLSVPLTAISATLIRYIFNSNYKKF
jgi:predicted PurR-regulated permease PerM